MVRTAALVLALTTLAGCATTADDAPAAAVCPPSRDWHVWIDLMPAPSKGLGLYISGEVDVPAGMVARVRPGPLDRMMPPGQRFTLELSPGKGPSGRQIIGGRVKTDVSVFREIIVSCGGQEIVRLPGDNIETAD